MRYLTRALACLVIASVSAGCVPFLGLVVPIAPGPATTLPSDVPMCLHERLRLVSLNHVAITPQDVARTVSVMEHRGLAEGVSATVTADGNDAVLLVLPEGINEGYLRQFIITTGRLILIAVPGDIKDPIKLGAQLPRGIDIERYIEGVQIRGAVPNARGDALEIDLNVSGRRRLQEYLGGHTQMRFVLVFDRLLVGAVTVRDIPARHRASISGIPDYLPLDLLTLFIATGPLPYDLQEIASEQAPCGG